MSGSLGYQFLRTFAGAIQVYRVVSTIAERDAIPNGVRYEGMQCYVTGEDQDYQLRTGITNTDWAVVGSGGDFNININTSDDITEGLVNLFLTAAERAKLGYIDVTQNVDLDQLESDVAALGSGVVVIDNWDASSGSFPGGGTAQTGDLYIVDTAGTVDGVSFAIGDGIIAVTDNASTTTYSGNWIKTESTSDVTSVVGLTGVIGKTELLAALNVEDGATADQTAAEIEALLDAYYTDTDWRTQLTKGEVLGFVGDGITAGTQVRIVVEYDAPSESYNFTVAPYIIVYADLSTLVADQGSQNNWTTYEVTDATGTRVLNYAVGSGTSATPTVTETTTNDVLDAYNSIDADGWTITGDVPA